MLSFDGERERSTRPAIPVLTTGTARAVLRAVFRHFKFRDYSLGNQILSPPLLYFLYFGTLFYDRFQPFLGAFGRDAILPVFLEDFHRDSHAVTRACCAHIGVDPQKLPAEGNEILNVGTEKLYDTRLLRWLRRYPKVAFKIAELPMRRQNEVLGALRLRRPFGKRGVVWSDEAEALYRESVVPQARKFLELCGKPPDFWQLGD